MVAGLITIGIIVILECLLSLDNAVALGAIVNTLPVEQRKKALTYGIFGAYFFRGLALVFASVLMQISFLKFFGGMYLAYLTYDYFKGKSTPETEDDLINKENKWLYRMTVGVFGTFWSTVMTIELMDLVFSIDNVFAAVALTNNIYLVVGGVFVGILSMRFVTGVFSGLLEKHPQLEPAAFTVIALLGGKLMLSYVLEFFSESTLAHIMHSHSTNFVFSVITLAIFVAAFFWKPKDVLEIEAGTVR